MGHGGTWVSFVKCGKHCRQALSSLPTILSSSVQSFNDTKIFTGIISFELPLKSQSKLNLNLVNSASTSRCCIYQPALASTPKHHRGNERWRWSRWEMTIKTMMFDLWPAGWRWAQSPQSTPIMVGEYLYNISLNVCKTSTFPGLGGDVTATEL